MSNMLDEDEEFRDQFDDENATSVASQQGYAAPQPDPKPYRSSRPITSNQSQQQDAQPETVEEVIEQAEEEDVSSILSNARLRLEQGRLYEMIMNHNLFDGMDADPVAIKNVEKEIKKFAQQRMEIMLGMRQEEVKKEVNAFPMELFPFNSMEVDVLKSLAAAATQGASREAEPFDGAQNAPKKQMFNPIGGSSKLKPSIPVKTTQQIKQTVSKPLAAKPTTPVKRQTIDETTQRILEEEGVTLDQINEVFDPNKKPLTEDELRDMTDEQFKKRNKEISRRTQKHAQNPSALPMPSDAQMENLYASRAQQASSHPQMQMIMGLLEKRK